MYSINDPYNGASDFIELELSNAYKNVKEVKDNLPALLLVSSNLGVLGSGLNGISVALTAAQTSATAANTAKDATIAASAASAGHVTTTTTKASEAATSASQAATSASNAAASATASATSATSATSSATAAAASAESAATAATYPSYVSTNEIELSTNNRALKFKDANGSSPYFISQTDNNFVFYGTSSTGAAVPIWLCPMRTDTRTLTFRPNVYVGTQGSSASLSVTDLLIQHDSTHAYIRPINTGSRLYLGAANANVIQIEANGDVGVGTVPAYKFHVAGSVASGADSSSSLMVGRFSSGLGGSVLNTFGSATFVELRVEGTAVLRLAQTGALVSPDRPDAVGFKGIPLNEKTANYSIVLSDVGKMISITTGGVIIPSNAAQAFPIGSAVSIFNNSATAQTISIVSDQLLVAGVGTGGTRTLAGYGFATVIKVGVTTWIISGAGVT